MFFRSLAKKSQFLRKNYYRYKCLQLDLRRNYTVKKANIRIKQKLLAKEKIIVLLVGLRKQTWLYKEIYELLNADERFEVVAIAAPFLKSGEQEMVKYMDDLCQMLEDEEYTFCVGYDKTTRTYADPRKIYQPDIVIFSTNYDPHTHPFFRLSHYNSSLNYLVSYGMHVVNNGGVYGLPNNYLCYKEFLPDHRLIPVAKKYRKYSHAQYEIVGSPKLDYYSHERKNVNGPWKLDKQKYKRIIWAPHFSFKETGDVYVVASFLEICDYMLELVDLYSDSVEFVFKPHPLLRHELERYWDTDKINSYYSSWDRNNSQFYNGRYEELFISSDGMIFDSISFIVEYLFSGKPALYTICQDAKLNFNEFGLEAFKLHYHTNVIKEDIKAFIDDVVINGNDPMKEKRECFCESFVGIKNLDSSQLIYNEICEALKLD